MPVLSSYIYRLYQDGLEVAKVYAPTQELAWREIWRYVQVYSENGSVSVRPLPPEGWMAMLTEE